MTWYVVREMPRELRAEREIETRRSEDEQSATRRRHWGQPRPLARRWQRDDSGRRLSRAAGQRRGTQSIVFRANLAVRSRWSPRQGRNANVSRREPGHRIEQ